MPPAGDANRSADPRPRACRPTGELQSFLAGRRGEIDALLPAILPPPAGEADRVREAMAYALLAPGKRMRPLLAVAVSSMYGGPTREVLEAGCALEMVHAASLILDDLPCMDAATLRRGRAATHIVFGEATAILAAVALLNHAYGVVAGAAGDGPARERLCASLARRFSEAIGNCGVIGGQQADLLAEGRALSLRELEFIHSHKTGSLFIASAEVGAIVMGAEEADVAALRGYAKNLGLAFQITDDILDVQGSEAVTGKSLGKDAARTTFVTLCGVEGARELAEDLVKAAIAHLKPFGANGSLLEDLALFVARRDR